MPRCELSIKFEDSDELIVLQTADLIKKFPIFSRAMECNNCDWEQEDTIIEDAVNVPFGRDIGAFLIDHVMEYREPISLISSARDYPEANALSLDELKELIELAGYLECQPMVKVAALCIATKLNGEPISKIAEYFGTEHRPSTFFHENSGWRQINPAEEEESRND